MSIRKGIRALVVISVLGLSPDAFAYEVWNSCNTNSWGGSLGTSSDTELFVYIENDFAAELRACTPDDRTTCNNEPPEPDDSTLSETEVRSFLESAIEKWNQQTTGVSLHWGGVVNSGSPATACSSSTLIPKRPAVFVNFHGGCKDVTGSCPEENGNPITVTGTAGDVTSDCAKITIWGDKNTVDGCTADAYDWILDTDYTCGSTWTEEWRLITTLQHEIGHILGMGHANDEDNDILSAAGYTSSSAQSSASLMRSSARSSQGRAHPLSWDKDCAISTWKERSVDYKYMWAYNNQSYFGTNTHNYGTTRGFVSGGAIRTDPYGHYGLYDPDPEILYGLYTDDWVEYTTAPVVGSSTSFGSYNSLDSDLRDAHVAPTLTFDDSGSTIGSRMMVAKEGWALESFYEPPALLSGYSTDLFSSTPEFPTMSRCTSSPCSSWTGASTHLPPSVTYDPASDRMIVARIDTTWSSSNRRQGGSILIHPGFDTTSRLNEGFTLATSNTNPPSESDPVFDYEMATEHPVGVACTGDTSSWPYNCLLAWVDRGMLNGRVIYTYFRILSNGTVDWHGTAWARGGSETNSGVQAAYTWGRFRMVWKKRFGADKVEYTYNTGNYYNWAPPIERSAPGIVDIPTYLYHHLSSHTAKSDRNHAITWTVSDVSNN